MNDAMGAAIGKIVKSNSHIDYVCQVYAPGEMTPAPAPDAYAFGSFVAIESEAATGALIGVVYNTQLVNPDFGNLGPRLSSRADLEVFSPDYLMETATLVGLLTVGWTDAGGTAHQGVPALATNVNAPVRRLRKDELVAFHRRDGRLCLHYLPVLMAQDNPLVPPLLLAIIERLGELFPEERSRLTVMRNNLAWRRTVTPMG